METQNNQSPYPESNPETSDRRTTRRQRLAERRSGRSSSWVLGAVLVLVGISLMVENLSGFTLENWWALFILLPALGAFGNAWRAYKRDERISTQTRASLISGFLLTMVAAIFLLNLNWNILAPVLLILAGVGLLVNMLLPS